MSKLSPAAEAVLTAVTLTKYDVPPEGLPAFAEEMAPLIAAALRAVAKHCVPDDSEGHWVYIPHVLAIATELDVVEDDIELFQAQ